jgi:PAS domain S-box-containing protein
MFTESITCESLQARTRLPSLANRAAIGYRSRPTPAVTLFESSNSGNAYGSIGAELSNIIERAADERGLSIRALPGYVLSASIEGQIEYLSPDILRYTGKLPQDIQSDWSACVHPDDVERCRNLWTQLPASAESVEIEIRLRRHDGSYRWFRSTARAIRDSAGGAIRFCAVAWDVDDRVQAQQALEAQAQKLRLIVDTIPGSVWQVGRDGLEYLNRFTTDYTGKRPEELIDPGWQDVLHPDDIEHFRNTWLQTVNHGTPLSIDFRLRRRDGVFRWFRTQGTEIRGDGDRVTGWVGVDIDIDDARRAADAEALRKSEHAMRMIIETIPALVWRATPQGTVDYVNPRLMAYTGKTLQQLERSAWSELLHPEDIETTCRIMNRCLESGESYALTCRIRDSQGSYRWFEVRADAQRDAAGNIAHWYGMHIDVEESRKLQDALRQAQSKLERAAQLATVGELSASIAHEINQPLTAIAANAQACQGWLSRNPANLDKARASMANIIQDVSGAAVVVKRIRALFKESAPMKTLLNVNELIEEVVEFMRYELDRRRIRVELQLQSHSSLTLADRVQIQQVLVNLMQNGADALERSGEQARMLLIRARVEVADVVVEVCDNGVGFKSADRFFEAFFTTKEDGLGMGLAICHSIIETHAGRIWAAHNQPHGAVFGFALPVMSPVRPADG